MRNRYTSSMQLRFHIAAKEEQCEKARSILHLLYNFATQFSYLLFMGT